jgi:tetratricopeptide (TPR) repeat protein
MSNNDLKLQIAILEYLQRLSQQPGNLDADSLDVAVLALSESLSIDLLSSDVTNQYLSKQQLTLEDVFDAGVAKLTGVNNNDDDKDTPKSINDISEEDNQSAEQFKNNANSVLSSSPQAAYDLYTKAIQLNPFQHIYWNNRAVASFKLDQFQRCIEDAKKSIKVNPSYSKSHYRLGLAYVELKKWGDALDALNKAKEIAKKGNETALVSEIDSLITSTKQQQKSGNNQQQQQSNPMGGFDMNSLLGSPQVQQMMQNPAMMQQMMGMLGGQGGNGGMDINSLMSNPMLQQMMSGMFAGQQQQGDDDDDGDYDDNDDDNAQ